MSSLFTHMVEVVVGDNIQKLACDFQSWECDSFVNPIPFKKQSGTIFLNFIF